MNLLNDALFANALWILVVAGWIAMLLLGLEADKPLSGDLPGQRDPYASPWSSDWNEGDQLGEMLAWGLFGGVGAALIIVLYWVLAAHGFVPPLLSPPM